MSDHHQIPFGPTELVTNPEPRCPCLLLLDTSLSMRGAKIAALNAGLRKFVTDLRSDTMATQRVEIGIITFGPVHILQPFQSAEMFEPPVLGAHDDTPMGEAIEQGLAMLAARKAEYRQHGISYFRPWVFAIGDGAPTDDWHDAARQVHDGEARKAFSFFCVGVDGANMDIFSNICSPGRPPVMLAGLNFRELFVWLSASLSGVARSQPGEQVLLPAPTGWASV